MLRFGVPPVGWEKFPHLGIGHQQALGLDVPFQPLDTGRLRADAAPARPRFQLDHGNGIIPVDKLIEGIANIDRGAVVREQPKRFQEANRSQLAKASYRG